MDLQILVNVLIALKEQQQIKIKVITLTNTKVFYYFCPNKEVKLWNIDYSER